jgi:hypothetical protein
MNIELIPKNAEALAKYAALGARAQKRAISIAVRHEVAAFPDIHAVCREGDGTNA